MVVLRRLNRFSVITVYCPCLLSSGFFKIFMLILKLFRTKLSTNESYKLSSKIILMKFQCVKLISLGKCEENVVMKTMDLALYTVFVFLPW